MKLRYALVAFCLLIPIIAAQAETQNTVSMEVTANDLQIYASAIRLAAQQCGADKEVACQIGMNEKLQLDKLNKAAEELNKKAKK